MTTPHTAYTLAMIAATQARLEGMKAKNSEREANGYALAYDDEAFFAEASQLGQIAIDCLNQPQGGA